MAYFPKPAERSRTEQSDIATEPVCRAGSISAAPRAPERDTALRWTWMHVGRAKRLRREGRYVASRTGIAEMSRHLLLTFCPLVIIAFPEEAWSRPAGPDSGPAGFDGFAELAA
ncbi:hypothetical protein ACIBO4_04175 [Streptomyces sp. NPDC050149]|uniref:hypothetical protein n=1 Tax=unclassified Streptomyces TaxID=2593676 RepID=UPI002E2EE71D|nr:hypothetical protein [Streptomyces sp. NBC_01358]